MNTNSVNTLQTALLQNGQYVRELKEGSSVLVRIIQKNNNGTFLGTVGGARVQITSSKEMLPGSTFVAKTSYRNGKLVLVPEADVKEILKENRLQIVNSGLSENLNNPLQNVQNEAAAKLLSQFNLPATNLALHLLQQFKQLGLTLNAENLTQIYKNALKKPGQEINASELLSILLKKGIELSDDDFDMLLKLMENDGSFPENNSRINFDINKSEINEKEILEELKNFFFSLLKVSEERKTGVLALFNHLLKTKAAESSLHWIVIPFEVNMDEAVAARGNFRLLFNENKLNKVMLCAEKENNEYSFLINNLENKKYEILFGQKLPDLKNEAIFIERMKKVNPEIRVIPVNFDELTLTGAGDEQLAVLEASV